MRFWQVKNRDKVWFEEIRDITKFIGKFEYFGTFHFEQNYLPTFDEAQKSITHFRNVVRKKMFGKSHLV